MTSETETIPKGVPNEPMPLCDAGQGAWQCDRPRRRRKSSLCGGHEQQVKRGAELVPLRYQAWGGRPSQKTLDCPFPGCTNKRRIGGLCSGHHKQQRLGQTLRPLRRATPHPTLPGWNAAWTDPKRGYAHVNATGDAKRKTFEHRAVMEHLLGRPLLPQENVHHINGVRNDNRPENLELWSTMQPPGQSVADKVNFAWQIIDLYDPEHRRQW